MIKSLTISVLLTLLSLIGYSQYFNTGQDPASIKWKQIKTDDFQIIFPQESEEKARYVAALFEDLMEKGGESLQRKPKRFSVVLHTHSSTSNGLVAWAPKRIELYTTSSADNDAQIWLDHLATHEYRHVVQLDKIEQGFTRVLNYIFGQQATAVVVGLYLPPWFLEGDAVGLETSLSFSGRGRLPQFEQELRAQLLEKGEFSYDKAINGSYKNYVTDRYKLGYYLVSKARINYGDQIWEKTLTNVARKPLGIVSFSNGIKESMTNKREKVYLKMQEKLESAKFKIEGIDLKSLQYTNEYSDGKLMLYFDSMKELLLEWKIKDSELQLSEVQLLSEREKYYTNKRIPTSISEGKLIYLKQGLSDEMHFEMLSPDGKTEKLFTPGYLSNTDFDARKDHLLWAEYKQDIRWEHADKSVVVSYNINSKERRTYQHNISLFSPSFSRDGKKIVAVGSDHKGDNSLLTIDTETGLIGQRILAGKNEYYQSPRFIDNEHVVLILLNQQGKHLVKMNLNTQKKEVLFSSGFADMSRPVPNGNTIYFNASFAGIDNLFALQLGSNKLYQLSSSRFGARDAFVGEDQQLYYSDYTSDGYLIAKTVVNQENWKEWNGDYYEYPIAEKLSEQEEGKLKADTSNLDRFEVKNYSKLANLFHFHSWAPVFIDGLEAEADIGVSIASQNKLSTLFSTIGYKREEGFDNGQLYANLSYRGWFPIVDSKFSIGDRNSTYLTLAQREQPEQVDTLQVNTEWRQWEWENSISLPFNFSSGQYSRKLVPKFTYSLVKFADLNTRALATTPNNSLGLGNYNFIDESFTQEIMEYQLFGYNIARTAPRDVQYQWAQIFELNYRNTPWGDRDLGNTWSAEAHLYFPGFVKHHGIKLYGGYQYRSLNNSRFSNSIKSPRGMFDLYGKHIGTLGADYAMPLFYPDWNLGPLAYFKRLKMNAFIDYGYQDRRIENEEGLFQFKDDFISGGLELRTDLHVLRFSAPVDLGVRVGYENQSKGVFADFLISFSLTAY
ncbi:hypothetical protein [Marinifilum caeruleilacunae]|uniref:Bacterial surface antigen (D15) domain-containing protein n=1 Tax=Marinifilum caeruleilacunae TaxID=2499076 RepID=A0ABX1WWZ2_9BACT|nr:hypothetical protein [Marinifilum caeruleilacunae]NOU60643.1 hypothetical protein [Marinifilum caeruleilacunae]